MDMTKPKPLYTSYHSRIVRKISNRIRPRLKM